jgi:hypothetical protein
LQLVAENNNHPRSGHRLKNLKKADPSVYNNVNNQPLEPVFTRFIDTVTKEKTNTLCTNNEKTAPVVGKNNPKQPISVKQYTLDILNAINKSFSKWQTSKQKVAPNSKETQAGFSNNNIFFSKWQKSKQKVAPNSKETQAGFSNNNIFVEKYR